MPAPPIETPVCVYVCVCVCVCGACRLLGSEHAARAAGLGCCQCGPACLTASWRHCCHPASSSSSLTHTHTHTGTKCAGHLTYNLHICTCIHCYLASSWLGPYTEPGHTHTHIHTYIHTYRHIWAAGHIRAPYGLSGVCWCCSGQACVVLWWSRRV